MHSGATDGYFDLWVPDSGNFTRPIETECVLPSLTMTKELDGMYCWTCTKCRSVMRTYEYIRPKHLCQVD